LIQELHRHNFFFILVLSKAKGRHEIDFVPHTITNNSVFIMRPGQVHQLHLKAGSEGYLISFDADYIHSDAPARQVLQVASRNNYYRLSAARIKKLLSLTASMAVELIDQHPNHQEVIKANLTIVFIELVRLQEEQNKDVNPNSYPQQRLDELLDLIEKNLVVKKEVASYAELLNLSSFQLNSITKKALGKTCSEVINELIILEAKRYLLATSNKINQIAYHLGYEDVSYFIRFFRKHTGYSPEAFRHNFM
jgi:AraC-like DNA-binding protein